MIKEKEITLIDAPQGYYLAHFTNADFDLKIDVSREINKIFEMELKLGAKRELYYSIGLGKFGLVGTAIPIDNVFNLITTKKLGHETTYSTLTTALIDMKEYMDEQFITKVAIPKFTGEANRLQWELVLKLITNLFSESKYDVLICLVPVSDECAKDKITVEFIRNNSDFISLAHIWDEDDDYFFTTEDDIFDVVNRALSDLEGRR